MTLNRPYTPFASFIPWWFIMNPKETMAHAVDDDYGAKWLLDHDTGSGPYKVVRAELGNVWELERVQDYWAGSTARFPGSSTRWSARRRSKARASRKATSTSSPG